MSRFRLPDTKLRSASDSFFHFAAACRESCGQAASMSVHVIWTTTVQPPCRHVTMEKPAAPGGEVARMRGTMARSRRGCPVHGEIAHRPPRRRRKRSMRTATSSRNETRSGAVEVAFLRRDSERRVAKAKSQFAQLRGPRTDKEGHEHTIVSPLLAPSCRTEALRRLPGPGGHSAEVRAARELAVSTVHRITGDGRSVGTARPLEHVLGGERRGLRGAPCAGRHGLLTWGRGRRGVRDRSVRPLRRRR